MKRLPLRWVVLLPVVATISVGFVVFAVYIDGSERATRLAEIDRELVRAARVEVAPPAAPPDTTDGGAPPAPAPTDDGAAGVDPPVQLVVTTDGRVSGVGGADNPFSEEAIAALAATATQTTTEVEDHRVLVSPRPDGQVRVTALSLAGYRSAIADLRRSLVVGGLVIALLEAAMAWWLAGRLVRPLATMATTANRIAGGALDTEVVPVGGSREVAELSSDIERMVERLRAALAEREQSAAEAARARDDMRRFLADVSHEIRTPLTALKGYSDLYDHGMLTEPGALDRAMSRVGSESVRLHALVNSMLDLVRDGGARAHVAVPVDVAEVVGTVADDLRVVHPARRIDVEIGPSVDASVVGDPARIHQAVLNLGANACTHTDAGSPVALVVEATPAAVTVSVVDHGPGVGEAEQEDIFLPFYRSDPSRVRDGRGGAGLGLAVTRQVALEHHGSVSVRPTPGGGATFVLGFPRAAPDTLPPISGPERMPSAGP